MILWPGLAVILILPVCDALRIVSGKQEQTLLDCINSNQPKHKTTTWERAIHDLPSRYEVIGVFWSQKPSTLPLTVATQLSFNRKWQLKAMCKSWPGPISAVMHMPTVRKPDAVLLLQPNVTRKQLKTEMARIKHHATKRAYQIHKRLQLLPCQLDMMLIHEQYEDETALMRYPVNTLRNFARLQARTPLVGLIDVDILLSKTLSTELSDPAAAARYIREATQERKIWVLPAFITRHQGHTLNYEMQLAERLVRSTKEALHALYDKEVIVRFDPDSVGHMPTNYKKWFRANATYLVHWQPAYEPWVFSDRFTVPWADRRFRGYGKNKIVILQALNYSGFQFLVHPSAFLVHRPHAGTTVKSLHGQEGMAVRFNRSTLPQRFTVYGHNTWLANMITKWIAKGIYQPKVDVSVRECVKELSWWQLPAEGGQGPLLSNGLNQVPAGGIWQQVRESLAALFRDEE